MGRDEGAGDVSTTVAEGGAVEVAGYMTALVGPVIDSLSRRRYALASTTPFADAGEQLLPASPPNRVLSTQ